MNKIKSTIVAVLLISTLLLSGCANIEQANRQQAYEDAITELKQTTINEDGTYAVTGDLIIALENAEYTEPKNIIYMIGDGMGANIIQATQETYADKLHKNRLAINHLPKVGTQSTYSTDEQITDSAAGGTALSTGLKTSNQTIAMDPGHTKAYKTVLELAAEKGKSTGIVATKAVTDATPASFTAHVPYRKSYTDIAGQQLKKLTDGSLDLVLGGGDDHYEHYENAALLAEAKNSGVSYSTNWNDTSDDQIPLAGLYADISLDTTDEDVPTLSEMTDLALDLLSEDENGFFLMVEGSQIDTKAHANLLKEEMYEMYQFDSAVAVAMKFVAMNPDTVLIITADHETGGLYFPQEGYLDSGEYVYLSKKHTSINVPVYAIGYETDKLDGIMENTDLAGFVASLLGEDDFGHKSSVIGLYDSDDSGPIELTFDENTPYKELLTDEIGSKINEVKNARAIHLVVSNRGEDMVTLPSLKITTADSISYDAIPQYAFIKAGKTLELTYILPEDLWQSNALSDAKSIRASYEIVSDNSWKSKFGYDSETSKLDIKEITITERRLDK